VIQRKIPEILIEILSSGNFQETIERWITVEFEINKLKKISRTQAIHEYLKKKTQYEKLLNVLQSEVSKYES
jgi:hypothetical protein